jgi:transcriptional regulator with XRE-family HTH domain
MAMTDAARPSLNDRVAAEIRAEMARQRLTLRELAETLGVSHTWVGNRLTSVQPIDFVDVEKVAAALGVPVSRLLPAAEPTTR